MMAVLNALDLSIEEGKYGSVMHLGITLALLARADF